MTAQTSAPTLRLAVLPRAGLLADAALIAGGAGLMAPSAQFAFKLPFTPVPITGQTFSVLLVGAALRTVRGGASAPPYLPAGPMLPGDARGREGGGWFSSASGG